jgi:hypothetical protein
MVSSAEASVGAGDRLGRAGTATGLLITQRSEVQILPPLPSQQVKGLFRSWKGSFDCGLCTGLCTSLSFQPGWGLAVAETCHRDLRRPGTRVTFPLALLGAEPRDGCQAPAHGAVHLSLLEFMDRAGDVSHG